MGIVAYMYTMCIEYRISFNWNPHLDMTDKQEKLDLLCKLLIEENSKYNLTRIVDPEQIAIRHFEDSLVVLELLESIGEKQNYRPKLIDIGSGAGFPSLALAVMLDDWDFVSLEATGKKVNFQQLAAKELGLDNFTAINGRAEDLAHDYKYRQKFNVATARAVGHLAMIAELAVPFLNTGGMFLAWKGPKVVDELPKASSIITKMGAVIDDQIPYTLPDENDEDIEYCIVKTVKKSSTPSLYPRQFGIIKKDIK